MKKIPYGRQHIDKSDLISVNKSLKKEKITTGNFVDLFEKKITKKFKSKYSLVCNSATAGLHLAYLSIDIKKNDIILMPAINFIASFSMAKILGAKIFLVDVDPVSGQMTSEKILECIKKNNIKKIKAIISMYLGGYVENNILLYNLKKKYNFYIIEDACHAIGASYTYKNKKYPIGSCKHSDICIFSLHPVKTITSGEGGIVLTNSKKIAKKIRSLRSHGIERDKKEYWKYDIKQLGFNYRLSDINCALGVSQLLKLDKFIKKRREIFLDYVNEINKISKNISIYKNKNFINGFHLIVLNINFENFNTSKDSFFKFLNKFNIFPQYHYNPIYRFSFFKKKLPQDFIGAEKFYKNSISLPIFYDLKKQEIEYIVKKIKLFLNKNKILNV
jgi:dTDP-4-amino-4,6-dideoxygalactose transaminase